MYEQVLGLLMLSTTVVYCDYSFPIIHLQEDGKFTATTFLQTNVSNNLTNYSFCIRYWLNYQRSAYTSVFTYGNSAQSPDVFLFGTLYVIFYTQ
jgi:hypothetical protein